jgi:hypothetical protein
MGGPAAPQLCTNCGTELRAGTRFCRACGQSAQGDVTPSAPFPSVPSTAVPATAVPDRPSGPAAPGVTAQDGTLHLPGGGLSPRPSSLDDTVTSSGVPTVPPWPQRPPDGSPSGPQAPGSYPRADDQTAVYQPADRPPPGYQQAGYQQAGYQQAGYQQAGYQQAGYQQAGYQQAGYQQAEYPPPDYPPGRPPGDGGGSRRGRILLALLAVIVVAGGIAAGLLIAKTHTSGGTGSAASSPPAGSGSSAGSGSASSPATSGSAAARQQGAGDLSKLLAQSVSDRGAINDAYNDVASCGPTLAQDQGTFQQAATSRQALLSQLGSMPDAAALPASMISSLTQAWTASIKADQDFAAWAADESTSCTPNGSDAHLSAATVPDNQATQDKTAFVGSWNPIAQQYGLATYAQDQL